MESISITNARQDLYKLAQKAVEGSEPILITSKTGDVIMISADDFNALQETVYLLSVPGMRESLIEAAGAPDKDFVEAAEVNWGV